MNHSPEALFWTVVASLGVLMLVLGIFILGISWGNHSLPTVRDAQVSTVKVYIDFKDIADSLRSAK